MSIASTELATGPVAGYAEAIVTVAQAEGVAERVSDELYQVARAVEGHAELGQRLTDAGVDTLTKLQVVSELLVGRAHQQTISAVLYVIQAGRARQLVEIADEVVRRAAASRQRSVAEVRTAVPLEADEVRRLTDALSRATGQQVEAKVTVDPAVVGGVVVTMGDTVIDGSIARRLQELRIHLSGA